MPTSPMGVLSVIADAFPVPVADHSWLPCEPDCWRLTTRLQRKGLGKGMEEVRERFQNLHEIVAAARAKLNRDVWDYLIGGAETETTVRRNRLALDSLALRPRILRNVGTTDTSGTFLGRKLKMPVALAPIGSIERFDPAATAAIANAAGTFGCAMFQSSVSKPELEETGK